MGLDGQQVVDGDALHESSGVRYREPLVVDKDAHPAQRGVIPMAEGVHERLPERPVVEFGHRLSEQPFFVFSLGVPRLEHFPHLFNRVEQGLVEVLVDPNLRPLEDLERGSRGGRAVDDDVVVVRLDGREPGAHHPLAGHRHEHRHLHGGELDVGGHEVDALAVAEHPRRGVVVRARYRGGKVGGEGRLKRARVPPSEGLRQVSLGVGVDEKHPAPRPGERDPQAQRRGGLGRPSLLVGDGYRPACHLSSSHLRRCRVSGGQEVSESQSGAGPCRSAAFGRLSARSRISFGNGRPHAEYAVGKRGNWTGISSVSPVSQTHPTEGA